MRLPVLVLLLAGLFLALPGSAQDDAGAGGAAGPPAETPADSESEAEASDGDDAEEEEDDFEFSEEIPADEQLVFPVDI